MSGFQITITDAGRAALIDAQNTGTVAFRLSQIGVSTQHVGAGLPALTLLPNERKRLATMAGDVVADDTLHVTIRDETADAYALRAFGLYTSTGVLFAVYSQADPILEKSDAAMLLLAIDAKLVALGTAQIEFGPADFSLPPASESLAGVVEIATDAEVDAGVDPWRVITARTLKRALAALSGFALLGHKHDAGDTTTGVFNVGRIPALDMSKITGLATALAGKASDVHTHAINQILGLTEALSGKAASIHQHAADDIVSGVLAVGRIPALAMEKITGLAGALASKASLGATVKFGDVRASRGGRSGVLYFGDDDDYLVFNAGQFSANGPFHAPALSSNGNPVWHSGNFNPATKGTLGADVDFRDVNASRGDGQGVIFLGDRDHYLYWNGSAYVMPNGSLFVNGHAAWTAENFNPAAKADLNGWTNPEGEALVRGLKTFVCPIDNTIAGGTDNYGRAALEVRANTSAGAAYLAFHRPGQFATFLGFDIDNELKIGGWSMGAQAFRVWSERNLLPASQAETVAGAGSDRFVTPASLWSFARSIGPNGYQQIPGTDLIVQWGVSAAIQPEGAVHAALPVAFGGGCLFASAMPRNAAGNITSDYYMQVVGRYLDRIVFFANRANGGAGNVPGYEWMALGLARGNPDPAFDGGGGLPPGGGGGGDLPVEV